MIRSFCYPLHPTKEQEVILEAWRLACCELYNAGLQERRDAWKKQHVNITRFDQQKELTQLRAAYPEWNNIPVWVTRSALARVDHAFDGFFRRVKLKRTPGFPRFKSRDRYSSFDFGTNPVRIDGTYVNLPKLGMVRFHKYRELRGTVKTVRVHRDASGWTISFVCDIGKAPAKTPVKSTVGIDVGLEAYATLSNGERVENPRFLRASAETLARRQRSLAQKKRGSNSRRRQKRLVASAHKHIRNQRLDHARKLAVALFSRFDMVVHEDLKIARMVHSNLAKSIYDAAWGQFLSALQSKAESAGKWCVPVDPRGTSQRCSGCGNAVKKTLSQREHRCEGCGLVLHRDENAARNVLALGLSAVPAAEASKSVGL